MKAAEFRKLTIDELRIKEKDLKEEMFLLRLRHAIKDPADTMKIKGLKKDIARVLTIIKEKEIATEN
jgi:large subunit ribosomal protein L29